MCNVYDEVNWLKYEAQQSGEKSFIVFLETRLKLKLDYHKAHNDPNANFSIK